MFACRLCLIHIKQVSLLSRSKVNLIECDCTMTSIYKGKHVKEMVIVFTSCTTSTCWIINQVCKEKIIIQRRTAKYYVIAFTKSHINENQLERNLQLLNYLAFQSFNYRRTWWRLFQKRAMCTNLEIIIYVFIFRWYWFIKIFKDTIQQKYS